MKPFHIYRSMMFDKSLQTVIGLIKNGSFLTPSNSMHENMVSFGLHLFFFSKPQHQELIGIHP